MHDTKTTDAPPKAYVGRMRKDGKFPVRYVYPISGRSFLKIETFTEIGTLQSKGYLVIDTDRQLYR